jgi:flagellar hook-associated protein 1
VRTSLYTLAADAAGQINAVHQSGRDSNGSPGAPLFDASAGAAGLQALISDPDLVAAADASSENGTALAFATLRGRDGPEADWASLVSQHGLLTANAKAQDAAATARQSIADEARAAISDVDLDQEAADLLRYQQAFEGAARTIQVARETIQSILNIF